MRLKLNRRMTAPLLTEAEAIGSRAQNLATGLREASAGLAEQPLAGLVYLLPKVAKFNNTKLGQSQICNPDRAFSETAVHSQAKEEDSKMYTLISRRKFGAGLLQAALVPSALATSAHAADEARLQEALSNMQLMHEIVPFGIDIKSGWHVGPYVVMGTEPYAAALPTWWRKGRRHAEWHSLAPWFTVYLDANGTRTSNTGVEIFGIEAWAYLESTRTWQLLEARQRPSWQGAYNPNAVQSLMKSGGKAIQEGGFLAMPTTAFMVHGGIPQTTVPWTERADLRALLVSVRHRLALIDPKGADDRAQAAFGVLAGADYYPWVGAGLADLEADYNPGAGSGRFLKVTPDWRYSTVLLTGKTVTATELTQAIPPEFVY
jgi:hypothetical protein